MPDHCICYMKLIIMSPLATDGPLTFSWKTRPAYSLACGDDRDPKGFGHRMTSLVYRVAYSSSPGVLVNYL